MLLAIALGTSVVAAGGLVLAPPAAAVVEYYVSPTGSDTTGDGSAASPWATIQKARDSIRGELAGMASDIIVNIAPGDYYQASTVAFTEADSGRNGFNVVYRSSGAVGSARFFGGQPVTGWTQYQGSIYRANIGAGRSLNTLYENGTRARQARYPNYQYDAAYPMAQAPYLYSASGGSYTSLPYNAADLAGVDFSNLSGASVQIWSGGTWEWFTDKTPISSVDTTNHVITLSQETRYEIQAGSRYYIQGMLGLLDQPGEFHYDSASGYLYYWPQFGDINSQTIIAPSLQQLFSVAGSSPASPAHHITFDGLTLAYTDFTSWYRQGWVNAGDSGEGHQYPSYDRQVDLPHLRTGMVFLTNTHDVTITNSHLTNSGLSAIYMLSSNHDNSITNNWINRSGFDGVHMQGRYPNEGDVMTQNTISNNLIHNVGEINGQSAGVFMTNSSNNTLSNLDISHSPRYSINIHGLDSTPSSAIYSRDNTVTGVRIHDTSQDSGDTGSIYSWGLGNSTPNTNVNYWSQLTINHIRSHPSQLDYAPFGVYMDDHTNNQSFANVQVSDTQSVQFHQNTTGPFTTSNVSWLSGFNESGMDYPNIGLTSSFPYPGGANFVGDFSNGLTNWSAGKGTPSTSTTPSHSGQPSFAQNEDTDVIYTQFVRSQNKRVSLWLYDDTTKTNLDAFARVDNNGGFDGGSWRGLGVRTDVSATHYVYRVGSTFTATTVPRSTGWHELTWDYTSGTGVDMYIDGQLVASPTGTSQFNMIAMGDWWSNGVSETAYWADVLVDEYSEGFEDGLGAFVAGKGMPATSTAQARSGSASYVSNQDTNVISTTLPGKHYQVAGIWFYDSTANTDVQSMARVDDGHWNDSNSWRGMGINTAVSATNYVYRVGTTVTATSVPRTTGWHHLTWDYTSGAGVTMAIDGTPVATVPGIRQFNMIAIGDWWADGRVTDVYWDDVTVSGE